jgi:hypothetical protein
MGTALYFLEYDGMRHLLGRNRLGEQGPTPAWLPIHQSVVPFFCGSLAGVRLFSFMFILRNSRLVRLLLGHLSILLMCSGVLQFLEASRADL